MPEQADSGLDDVADSIDETFDQVDPGAPPDFDASSMPGGWEVESDHVRSFRNEVDDVAARVKALLDRAGELNARRPKLGYNPVGLALSAKFADMAGSSGLFGQLQGVMGRLDQFVDGAHQTALEYEEAERRARDAVDGPGGSIEVPGPGGVGGPPDGDHPGGNGNGNGHGNGPGGSDGDTDDTEDKNENKQDDEFDDELADETGDEPADETGDQPDDEAADDEAADDTSDELDVEEPGENGSADESAAGDEPGGDESTADDGPGDAPGDAPGVGQPAGNGSSGGAGGPADGIDWPTDDPGNGPSGGPAQAAPRWSIQDALSR